MASDKIISKILENANAQAAQTIEKAKQDAQRSAGAIQKETEARLHEMALGFKSDSKEIQKREALNSGLEERKNMLASKRRVMDMAFERARENMRNLSDSAWADLITKIVVAGTVSDTEYIKVPKKDFKKYLKPFNGGAPFLEQLNQILSANGHERALKLDKNPAWFEDGIMLIGKYSDVNGSFDVLIENIKDALEWDVTQILFGSEA